MDRGRGLPAGLPVPSIQVRILPDQWGTPIGPYTEAAFAAACLPSGEAGEIVVNGAHVLAGYLRGHRNSENKFNVGSTRWHRTGDAGYVDKRGRLWLLGRCTARIDDARGRLYPLGVESMALRHPDVRRAAFVGHRGQRVLALELRRGARVPDLARLAKDLEWAHVDEIQLHTHIPVDARHNAKVDHSALAARLNERSHLSRLLKDRTSPPSLGKSAGGRPCPARQR
jgi:acyl-CoA synthetase (AMP-forming)/AMP-acid ligase II